jgi:hypothetical protein
MRKKKLKYSADADLRRDPDRLVLLDEIAEARPAARRNSKSGAGQKKERRANDERHDELFFLAEQPGARKRQI